MRFDGVMAIALALAMPGLAMGQSNPVAGMGSAQIHGQRLDMRHDLHNASGAPAATNQPASPRTPQTRTQMLRQRSVAAQRQVRQQAARRAVQRQRQAAAGQATRLRRTGTGTPAARSPDTMAAHEARMAEARRRQAAAEERVARVQMGVR